MTNGEWSMFILGAFISFMIMLFPLAFGSNSVYYEEIAIAQQVCENNEGIDVIYDRVLKHSYTICNNGAQFTIKVVAE